MKTFKTKLLGILKITKLNQLSVQEPKMKNGDTIKITWLPPCKNAKWDINPYIGMQGIVHDFNGKTFHLFTGSSWLAGIEYKNCNFEKISIK